MVDLLHSVYYVYSFRFFFLQQIRYCYTGVLTINGQGFILAKTTIELMID
jgi:hypothetical protein